MGEIAEGYRKGVNWFPRLNPVWKSLIGALEFNIVQDGCECTSYDYGEEGETWQEGIGEIDCYSLYDEYNINPIISCNPVYIEEAITIPSDGFILTESAMNGPGMNYDVQFMDGSNHMQMKNDSKMKDAVDAIFIHGLGKEYFITEEK